MAPPETSHPSAGEGSVPPGWRERLALAALEVVSRSDWGNGALSRIVELIRSETEIAGAAVCMRQGTTEPCCSSLGFPTDYLASLCSDERNLSAGAAGAHERQRIFDALCDRIISGSRANSRLITEGGSFYAARRSDLNDRDPVLENLDVAGILPPRFETHALIWVRDGTRTVALVQLGDPRPAFVTRDDVAFLERLCASVVAALAGNATNYRQLVDNLNVGVFRASTDGRLLQVNPATVELGGYSSEQEILGVHTSQLYAVAEDRARFLEQLAATGQVRNFETYTRRKDGSQFPSSLSAIKITSADGSVQHILGTVQDITERKLAEELLRKSERKFSQVFSSSPGIFGISTVAEGRFLDVNEQFLTASGYSRDEVIGKTTRDLQFWADPERAIQLRQAVRENGMALGFAIAYRKKSGEIGHALMSAVPFELDGTQCLLSQAVDITELKQANDQLALLSLSIDQSPDCVFCFDADGTILFVNEAGCRAFGYTRTELMHQPVTLINPRATPERWAEVWQLVKARGSLTMESEHRRKDGSFFPVEIRPRYFRSAEREFCYGFMMDITERRKAERDKEALQAQKLQAQRMESIGRLAGGVAHDFNNMLGVILGNAELALLQSDPSMPLHAELLEIQLAGQRSAELTAQLLAFARRQTATPRVIDLNATVVGALKLLRRLIGEHIQLEWSPGPDLWQVSVDPSQVNQILANLAANARDAIEGTGTIKMWTINATVDERAPQLQEDCAAGEYVVLAVKDDGCGMPPEVTAQLFEPFYTTKSLGEGTGLGLATVYGIVKQNNGFIVVESQLGEGATFNIYLPRHCGPAVAPEVAAESRRPSSEHGEKILLVEDEGAVLRLTHRMLDRMGYGVLTANCAQEALRIAQTHENQIDLLIVDVVMPEMSGRDLCNRVLELRPNIKRLFMSGYTADVIAHHGVVEHGVHFLQKPFTVEELSAKVREALSD